MERVMIKSGIGIALLATFVGLSGCATKAETIGTAGGMAAGAAVSNGGMMGTLGGAMLGYGAGRAYEDKHR
ncbi:MAG: hypothetical protein JO292_00935 [Betaproteobacteria bacterium]|nr:hypothetical protein [Betaproteobacteria bacterium]MBV9359929.1 hypothetical protein [Betaproteobacteria bacterium]